MSWITTSDTTFSTQTIHIHGIITFREGKANIIIQDMHRTADIP